MNKILTKKQLSDHAYSFVVENGQIARSSRPGNFVTVRADIHSERIPLVVVDSDKQKGTLTLVVQEAGLSSTKFCQLSEGDEILDVVGPLGTPYAISKVGTVVCVGGGVGTVSVLPVARAMKEAGNRVVSVVAAQTKDRLVVVDEMRQASDELIVVTDDGSEGQKGLPVDALGEILAREQVDRIVVVGPGAMMEAICQVGKEKSIPVDVALNAIIVDGTGICGSCRLTIGGKTRFVCIDGPFFDGTQVDWKEVETRGTIYSKMENDALEQIGVHLDKESRLEQTDKEQPTIKEPLGHGAENDSIEELTDRGAAWRDELRKSMKNKDRMALKRHAMPMVDMHTRTHDRIQEVAQGFTLEMAMDEARRCIDCAKPTCREGCPIHMNIPAFIKNIERGEILAADRVLKQYSSFSAICGRVCPQEKQCEGHCIHVKMKDAPVAIGPLERFVADYERQSVKKVTWDVAPANGIKVAIIGSGPSGLAFAGEMAKKGFEPHVFEALHFLGGVLYYGIPQYRLPDEIVDHELDVLRSLGVKFHTNCLVGKTVTIDELREQGFKGIYVATGAGKPKFMNIPGENAIHILSANEFLFRVNVMDADQPDSETPLYVGKKVIVVGGGNTAMDAARAALRAGAKTSTLVYRRTKKYMPADAEELELAVEDGVRFLELVAPVEQVNGKLKCEVMKLGDPDEKGRRSPVPTGEFTEINCDTVIAAVGERVDSDLFTANGIEVNTKGIPEFRTNLENVFVGGDAMRGPATVVEGIADAQYFANAVIGSVHSVAIPDDAHATRDEAIARKGVLCPPKAGCEGERCLHCNTVCQVCADVCPNRANVVVTMPDGRHEILHVDRMCNECGNCAVFCPYDSAPYRNKFTLFLTREGFDESTENQGFLPLEGRKVLVRLDGKVFEADLDGQNQLPADVETFILTVLKDYAYLL